jgi:hyaluronoglucosaminidase
VPTQEFHTRAPKLLDPKLFPYAASLALAVSSASAMAQSLPVATLPQVIPQPIAMRLTAGLLPIGPRATIVIQRDSDPETLRLVREGLAAIGVTDIRIAHRRPSTARETLIVLGMASDTTVAQALAQAGGTPVTDHEGYALASAASGGAALIVLAGADADGLYYGAQTFRQIATRGTMPALTIADHPAWRCAARSRASMAPLVQRRPAGACRLSRQPQGQHLCLQPQGRSLCPRPLA